MPYEPTFDIDFSTGAAGESLVLRAVGHGSKVEVKHDLIAVETGRVAVEVAYAGRPSGISVTQADWWIVVLSPDLFIALSTERLRQLVKEYRRRSGHVKFGGFSGRSQLVLLPLSELIGLKRN